MDETTVRSIQVCPECDEAQVVLVPYVGFNTHKLTCSQPPVLTGKWVAQSEWPVYISQDGEVLSDSDDPNAGGDSSEDGDEDVPSIDPDEVEIDPEDDQ